MDFKKPSVKISLSSSRPKSRMLSTRSVFYDKPQVGNTYRMESIRPFEPLTVQKIVNETMERNILDMKYDEDEVPLNISRLSMEIKDKVKALNFERYKIVVLISIGEKAGQSVDTSLRMLRDVVKDNYVTYSYENSSIYAYAVVFGFYCE